jgi:hypothetical protein
MLCNIVQEISQIIRRGIAPAALALAGLLVFGSVAANATPVYFTGPTGGTTNTGTNGADAAASGAPGIDLTAPPARLVDFVPTLAFGRPSSTPDCKDVGAISITCRSFKISLTPFSMPGDKNTGSESNPLEATTTWILENVSGETIRNGALYFITSPGAVTDDPTLVGLEPDPSDGYVILETDNFFFPAIEFSFGLGLAPGATFEAVINYRVKDLLDPLGDNFILPWLRTSAIVVAVPEPGAFSLFAFGLVSIAALRRRR